MRKKLINWLGGMTYREHFKKMDEVSEHVGVFYSPEYLPIHNKWIASRRDTCSHFYIMACKDKPIMSMSIGNKEYAITCDSEEDAQELIDKYVELYESESDIYEVQRRV